MNNVEPIWWYIGAFTVLAVMWAIASAIAEWERDRRDRREARAHLKQWRPSDEEMERIADETEMELHNALALHVTHSAPVEDCALCDWDQNVAKEFRRDDSR